MTCQQTGSWTFRVSAAHNAEKFGAELGYVVRFDADAIKSMAITVLINMSERPAR
jgi:hypothetical protein